METNSQGSSNKAPAHNPLHTEGPLCEKDEQFASFERNRKLQQEALERWEQLKKAQSRTR